MTITDEQHKALQRPFDPAQVGKLPRTTCQDCSKKRCQQHAKRKCNECGNYMSEQHIHLDYVGHAQVTARLLEVDPGWTWEPVAFDTDGLPAVAVEQDGRRVLWIRLTVCGVTRLGVGIVGSGKPEVEKELIGDALRNAAMRFGVALDLWAKGDLHGEDNEAPAPSERGQPQPDWKALGWDDKDAHDAALEQARSIARRLPDPHHDNVKAWVKDEAGPLPYTYGFMNEWMDMMSDLTAPDEPLPGVDDTEPGSLLMGDLPSVREVLGS